MFKNAIVCVMKRKFLNNETIDSTILTYKCKDLISNQMNRLWNKLRLPAKQSQSLGGLDNKVYILI